MRLTRESLADAAAPAAGRSLRLTDGRRQPAIQPRAAHEGGGRDERGDDEYDFGAAGNARQHLHDGPTSPAHGIVTSQATWMLPATPQRTAFRRRVMPAPRTDPEIV